MKLNLKLFCAVCIICFLMIAGNSSADTDTEYVKTGPYITVLYEYNIMRGDFDDTLYFTDGTWIYDVPDVDDGMGAGFIFGIRYDFGCLEIGYHRTHHDTSSSITTIGESEAAYNVVDLNVKYDIFAGKRIKPYLLAGIGATWLKIEDSATDGTVYENETFYGYEINLGAGVSYYFHPQWALTGGVIYRHNWFSGLSSGTLSETQIEKAIGLTFGISYTF